MKKEIFDAYLSIILDRFNISSEEIFKKDKSKPISSIRFLLYYLCRERGMTFFEIQKLLEDNNYIVNHSNIIYGVNTMSDMIDKDKDYRDLVNSIEQRVRIN